MLVSSPDEEALEDSFAEGELFLIQRRIYGAEAGSRFAGARLTTNSARQQRATITLCLSSIDFQRCITGAGGGSVSNAWLPEPGATARRSASLRRYLPP